jgi:hypothetical protein
VINRMGGFLERWAAFAGWAAFTLVVLGLGVTLGSALDRDPPVLASTVEGKANSETYRPGDTFSGVWTAKAVKACDGTADRRLEVMPSGTGHDQIPRQHVRAAGRHPHRDRAVLPYRPFRLLRARSVVLPHRGRLPAHRVPGRAEVTPEGAGRRFRDGL